MAGDDQGREQTFTEAVRAVMAEQGVPRVQARQIVAFERGWTGDLVELPTP